MWCFPSSPCWVYYRFAIFLLSGDFPFPGGPAGLPGSDRASPVHASSPTTVLLGPVGSPLFPDASSSGGARYRHLESGHFGLYRCHVGGRRAAGEPRCSAHYYPGVKRMPAMRRTCFYSISLFSITLSKWWLWPGFSFIAAYFMPCSAIATSTCFPYFS